MKGTHTKMNKTTALIEKRTNALHKRLKTYDILLHKAKRKAARQGYLDMLCQIGDEILFLDNLKSHIQ